MTVSPRALLPRAAAHLAAGTLLTIAMVLGAQSVAEQAAKARMLAPGSGLWAHGAMWALALLVTWLAGRPPGPPGAASKLFSWRPAGCGGCLVLGLGGFALLSVVSLLVSSLGLPLLLALLAVVVVLAVYRSASVGPNPAHLRLLHRALAGYALFTALQVLHLHMGLPAFLLFWAALALLWAYLEASPVEGTS